MFSLIEMIIQCPIRYNRKLMLSFKTIDHFKAMASDSHNFRNADYIFVYFEAAIGPMGLTVNIVPAREVEEVVEKLPSLINVSIGWSSAYPSEEDAPLNYKKHQLQAMKEVLKLPKLRERLGILEFDALYASHSERYLRPFYRVSQFVLFRTYDHKHEALHRMDYPALRRIIRDMGRTRVYLDVSPKIRKKILEATADASENIGGSSRSSNLRSWLQNTHLVALFLVICKICTE